MNAITALKKLTPWIAFYLSLLFFWFIHFYGASPLTWTALHSIDFTLPIDQQNNFKQSIKSHLHHITTILFCGYLLLSFQYGFIRSRAGDSHYWKWLATTPWKLGAKMPFYNIWPRWQDILWFIPLMVTQFMCTSLNWMWLPTSVMTGYGIGLLLLGMTTHEYWPKMVILITWPLACIPVSHPFNSFIILSILVSAIIWGTREGLKRYPWINRDIWQHESIGTRKPEKCQVLYPLTRIGPAQPKTNRSQKTTQIKTALQVATLGTWYAYILLSSDLLLLGSSDFETNIKNVLQIQPFYWIAISCAIALIRLAVYSAKGSSPLSTINRIKLRYLRMKGYDQVYFGPLCIILAGAITPSCLAYAGANDLFTFSLTTWIILFVAFGTGPSLERWHLVGFCVLKQKKPAIQIE